jgi:hypothetical protein
MIPKDTFSNLNLGIYQDEKEKEGRMVRGGGPDYPSAPGGLSARATRTVRAARGVKGKYWMFWSEKRTIRAGAPDHPRTSRTVRGGVADCPRVPRAGGSQDVKR